MDAKRGWQKVRLNRVVLAGDRQPLHHIVKFPDIARPIVPLQERQRCRSDALNAASAMLALQRLVLPVVYWLDDSRAFGTLRPRKPDPEATR